jgi:acyl-CoA reductase-like NAD-dependent aldehyde dehydrogenase
VGNALVLKAAKQLELSVTVAVLAATEALPEGSVKQALGNEPPLGADVLARLVLYAAVPPVVESVNV